MTALIEVEVVAQKKKKQNTQFSFPRGFREGLFKPVK